LTGFVVKVGGKAAGSLHVAERSAAARDSAHHWRPAEGACIKSMSRPAAKVQDECLEKAHHRFETGRGARDTQLRPRLMI